MSKILTQIHYYSSKRLGRVPLSSVEHILGFPINTKELEEKNHA
ncbi:DUF3173 family protein [Enterococcus asini]|nr:DUF3173 family protein [Enterococcus asini]